MNLYRVDKLIVSKPKPINPYLSAGVISMNSAIEDLGASYSSSFSDYYYYPVTSPTENTDCNPSIYMSEIGEFCYPDINANVDFPMTWEVDFNQMYQVLAINYALNS